MKDLWLILTGALLAAVHSGAAVCNALRPGYFDAGIIVGTAMLAAICFLVWALKTQHKIAYLMFALFLIFAIVWAPDALNR